MQLSNASTLRTLNGPLINVTGGSVINVSGALVNFGGTAGNVISVTNSLCNSACALVGNIPVLTKQGASVADISITNAIKNSSLGSFVLSSPNAAVIVVTGQSSKVTISGN